MKLLTPVLIVAVLLSGSASVSLTVDVEDIPTPSLVKTFESVPKKKTIDEISVSSVALGNFEKVIGDSHNDWLLYATASNESCARCPEYDKIFNETVVALQEERYVRFARMNCDDHVVLCNTFFAYGSGHLYHITHTDSPSTSVTAAGMPLVHHTHVRSIPFRPKVAAAPAAGQEAADAASAEHGTSEKQQILGTKTSAKPSSEWIIKVVKEELWKDFDEWKGWTQPFEGSGRHAVRAAWWLLYQVSSVPPFVTLLAITIGGRLLVSRIFAKKPQLKQYKNDPSATIKVASAPGFSK